VAFDRELVIVLSDWTFEDPARVYAKLKKYGEFYNRSQPTLADILRGQSSLARQLEWDRMRMSPADIADVTGATYTYLLNGHGPDDGWTGQFAPGERVRLRLINASAMTYFNVRIPGLPMTVIQADGQDVAPVEVEELQIAVAETADVIVAPGADRAWGIVAEAMARSGLAFGTLSPSPELRAAAPVLRPRPQRSMVDMGHGQHAAGAAEAHAHGGAHDAPGKAHADHGAHQASHPTAAADRTPGWTPRTGPGVANVVMQPMNRLAEPGTGLADVGHRVLTYADLSAREPFYDDRPPTREITLHLTGNMERYMWSFDGERASPRTAPIRLAHNERVRLVFINHTMMEHPVHLHGMWMELENGQLPMPRKHTISVKPAERLSVLVTADAPGAWAFHCHLLLHMKAGMMRTLIVDPPDEESRHGTA
jgi:CopA family copper-resistance protein